MSHNSNDYSLTPFLKSSPISQQNVSNSADQLTTCGPRLSQIPIIQEIHFMKLQEPLAVRIQTPLSIAAALQARKIGSYGSVSKPWYLVNPKIAGIYGCSSP